VYSCHGVKAVGIMNECTTEVLVQNMNRLQPAWCCELRNNRPQFALFSLLQGQFCKLPLIRVIFNRKPGDSYGIRSRPS
jgi:hypothetical protein